MLHIRAISYIYGLNVKYTGCMLHMRAVCYIYGLYFTYMGCMLHIYGSYNVTYIRTAWYIYGPYVTYTLLKIGVLNNTPWCVI